MKLIRVILVFTFCFSVGARGQSCKFKTNEVDKFTNKFTKQTKPIPLINVPYEFGASLSVRKVDTVFHFIFDYTLLALNHFEPMSINKGAELIFLLENSEKITLKSEDEIKGSKVSLLTILPPVYCCSISSVSYPVTKNQIQSFLNLKVKTVRFYRTESNGKEDFKDFELKEKREDNIQELVRCVL